jgi:dihydropteroate synthase
MGVVNITPDSFSDGGDFYRQGDALSQIEKLLEDGADVIDIGAESTRPAAAPVSAEEERNRLVPILEVCAKRGLNTKLSVDTRNDETARLAANEFDVGWVNNVAGLYGEATLRAIVRDDLNYIAMHMHGDPTTMQRDPLSGHNAVDVVERCMDEYTARLQDVGFKKDRIFLDPGIGFGKDDAANLKLLGETARFSGKYQVAIGVSRKSFIGRMLNITEPKLRDHPSKMLELGAILMGARLIRTHDVKPLARARDLLT